VIFTVLLFILGLILIIIAGDRFVDAAVAIAKASGISDIVIGATIVSLGTTLPEILVSTTASFSGSADIAVGNAFGSIICNTALIAGIVMLIRPEKNADRKSISWRILFFFVAVAVCFLFGLRTGSYGLVSGVILVGMFVVYALVSIFSRTSGKSEGGPGAQQISVPKNILILIICAAMLFVGARLLVTQGTKLALALGVPERVVAVTFIALGTSLPELVTAISSLIKGHADVSIGNILGANLINLLLVIGIPALLSGVTPSAAALTTDLPIAALSMAVLALPMIAFRRGFRVQGALLLAGYIAYTITQF